MKSKKDPISSISKDRKKRKMKKSVVIAFAAIAIGVVFLGYTSHRLYVKKTYESLAINFTNNREIEYGTSDYDPMSLVKTISDGKITKYTSLDTSKVGTKKLVFEITKDNVVKKISVKVKVKDSNAPTITLKEDSVNINLGDNYDNKSNIESVKDVVDGDIPYSDTETQGAYYTVNGNIDVNNPGEYNVTVKANDANGNESEVSYKVNVVKPAPAPTQNIQNIQNDNIAYTNSPATVDTSSVISAAFSLIGSRYAYGGTNPSSGFDCSGFVQYIFSSVGKSISRSSGTQLNDGVAVSRDNLQAGDIIIWSSNSSNTPTHSSVYVGDGNIVHAINSSRGVQESSLSAWESYGDHIVGIRRV